MQTADVSMTAMKAFLMMLRVPLALEAARILLHRIAHWSGFGTDAVDTISMVLLACIVFFAAWRAMRETRRLGQAVLAALLVWAFSLAVVALLLTVELVVVSPLPPGEAPEAIAGYAFASILFLPVVMAIAGIAAVVARRTASTTA